MATNKITPLEITWIKTRGLEIFTKTLYTTAYTAMIIFVAWAFASVICQIVLPKNGYGAYNLEGQSMQPTHYAGGLIISNNHNRIADLDNGDIICFENPEGENVCHRVYSMSEDKTSVETKGDHNSEPDYYTTNDDTFIGRVILYIPKAGFITHTSAIAITVFALLFALLTLLLQIILNNVEAQRIALEPTWRKFCANKELRRRVAQAMQTAK